MSVNTTDPISDPPRSATRRAMAPDQIEVERKYSAGDGVEAIARRVADLGGSEIGSVAFTDTYYDTPECALTANDVWLRRRDDRWEIKVPIPGDARRSGGERSVFLSLIHI